jgi:hypothetical protein
MTTTSAAAGAADGAEQAKLSWVYWTCTYPDCGHGFRKRTKKGLTLTCPKCGRVQEGPAGVRRLIEGVKPKRRRRSPAGDQAPPGRPASAASAPGGASARASTTPGPGPAPRRRFGFDNLFGEGED